MAPGTEDRVGERILDAAEATVLRVGAAKTRVGEVALAAGVSRQTVYHRFGSKRGLVEALAVRVVHEIMDTVEQSMRRQTSLAESIVTGIAVGLRTARDHALFRREVARAMVSTDTGGVLTAFDIAVGRARTIVAEMFPGYPEPDVELAAEVAVRLLVSHAVCQTEPTATTVAKAVRLVRAVVPPDERDRDMVSQVIPLRPDLRMS